MQVKRHYIDRLQLHQYSLCSLGTMGHGEGFVLYFWFDQCKSWHPHGSFQISLNFHYLEFALAYQVPVHLNQLPQELYVRESRRRKAPQKIKAQVVTCIHFPESGALLMSPGTMSMRAL